MLFGPQRLPSVLRSDKTRSICYLCQNKQNFAKGGGGQKISNNADIFVIIQKTFGSQLNFFTSTEQQNGQLKGYVSLSLFILSLLIFDRNIVTDSLRWFRISPPGFFFRVPHDVPQGRFPTLPWTPPHFSLEHACIHCKCYICMLKWDTVIFSHRSFKVLRSFQKHYSPEYEKPHGWGNR